MIKTCSNVSVALLSALVMISHSLQAATVAAAPGRTGAEAARLPAGSSAMKIAERYGELPLRFEANQGQFEAGVRFVSRQRGYSLLLRSSEAVLVLSQPDSRVAAQREDEESMAGESGRREARNPAVLRMKLIGADPDSPSACLEELPGRINYFIGSDPGKWLRGIRTHGKVQFSQVYPGIDLVYYGTQRQLEYDFLVAPGTDPGIIAWSIEGADQMMVEADGALMMETGAGQIRFRRPVIYQEVAGLRKEISGGYVVKAHRQIGFEIAAYDRGLPLVIDPVLHYSTYLGGSLGDNGEGIAVDSAGNAYVTGTTYSTNFPTANPGQPSLSGSPCVFVTKLNAAGSALIYSTYLGGSGGNLGHGIKVDGEGNAYVVGSTSSTNFPVTAGAFDRTANGNYDAFVAKLAPDGATLVYSTLLGGTGTDSGYAIALDDDGNAYITGSTSSDVIPLPTTAGAFQTTRGQSNDVYVAKLNPSGSGLVYSTLLGGGDRDIGYGIAVDADGAAYVTGLTASTNFPTTLGAFQFTRPGNTDAFVTKLNPDGSALVYSTYLGGINYPDSVYSPGTDIGNAIAVGTDGCAYVTGSTISTNFPTTAGAVATKGSSFLAKLTTDGSALAYSTLLDGASLAIAVDASGAACVTGGTSSTNFPITPGAFDPTLDNTQWFTPTDAFLMKMNANGTVLLYSTFLGANGNDIGRAIAVDAAGKIYVTGSTTSTNFPVTADALDRAANGNGDAFVTKIEPLPLPIIVSGATTIPWSAPVDQPFTFSVVATDPADAPLSYTWDFGDGTTGSGNPVTHSYSALGQYVVVVTVSNGMGSREAAVSVTVRPPNTGPGSVRFSESYAIRRKKVCWGQIFGGCAYYDVRSFSARFTASATLSLESFDISQLSADDPVRFQIGGFEFAGKLGDDPKYQPGASSAQLVLVNTSISPPKSIKVLTVKLKWDQGSLRARINGSAYWHGVETESVSPIVGDRLASQPSGTVQQTVPAGLAFAGARAAFDVPFTARIKTGTRVFTEEFAGPNFVQSSVRVSGSGSGAAE